MTAKNKFETVMMFFESNNFSLLSCSDDYRDAFSRLSFRDSDGYGYTLSYDAIRTILKRGRPNKFTKENLFSFENVGVWLSLNNPKVVLMGGEYKNAHTKSILLKCSECGMEWISALWIIINGGNCPSVECKYKRAVIRGRRKHVMPDKNFAKIFPELLKDWDYKNNEVLPSEISPMSEYRASWKCHTCGNSWKARVGNRSLGTGCPICNKSLGENKIEKFLEENGIPYTREFRWPNCKNKKALPFDFKIDGIDVVIEFNGEQHYRSIKNWGGQKGFEYRKKNDEIKKKYCEENRIKLIIIPYWEFDNIEEILKENF